MEDFYDQLAPYYHLIFHDDFYAVVKRQGQRLAGVIADVWSGGVRKVLDASCGIGTQAIGLAENGFKVAASDQSRQAVERARKEAQEMGLTIDFKVCDMRGVHETFPEKFDLVISCDNSIPHLLCDQQILQALKSFYTCTRPGGGCLLTVRDYDTEKRGKDIVKPYGIRQNGTKKYLLFQVWDFEGDLYDLSFYIIEEDLKTGEIRTHKMRSRYYAIGCDRLLELMQEAGYGKVRRISGSFFQPILVGTKEGK